MKVLSTYGVKNELDVLNFGIFDDDLQLAWFASHYIYFVANNREKCNPESFRRYLLVEIDILTGTKFKETNVIENLSKLLSLLITAYHQ